MHRGDDDLPGGNFVDHVRIQSLVSCQHLSFECTEELNAHPNPALLIWCKLCIISSPLGSSWLRSFDIHRVVHRDVRQAP